MICGVAPEILEENMEVSLHLVDRKPSALPERVPFLQPALALAMLPDVPFSLAGFSRQKGRGLLLVFNT